MPPSYISVAEIAARKAGKILLDHLGTTRIRRKTDHFDLVTEADLSAQEAIAEVLAKAFPGHAFLGEEGAATTFGPDMAENEFRWVVDPLDGTTNFVHGMPMFCTSIGLVRGEDLLCGVVYNPMTEEFFSAEKGRGAQLNGRPIKVSDWTTLGESLVAVSFPTVITDDSPDLATFLKSIKVCQAIRRTGSTALNLAYVAAGRFDATWAFQCHSWDIAAGTLLVLEAGGVVTQPTGAPIQLFAEPAPICAVANKELHDSLMRLFDSRHGT